MKNNFILLCAIAFSIFFASCQKEVENYDTLPIPIIDSLGLPVDTTGGSTGDTTGNALSTLSGTWKLVSSEVNTSATTQASLGSDVLKTITTSHYITENNAGSITIDSLTMIVSGLTYSVNSTSKSFTYTNGVLLDSIEMPLQSSLAPYNASAPYTRLGTDSLYFPNGALFSGGYTGASAPGSLKVQVVQDKLYFYQSLKQTTTTTNQGQTVTLIIDARVTTMFKR